MNTLGYLGIALVIAVIGGLIVVIALREPQSKRGDGVDAFRRRMDALAPGNDVVPPPTPVIDRPARPSAGARAAATAPDSAALDSDALDSAASDPAASPIPSSPAGPSDPEPLSIVDESLADEAASEPASQPISAPVDAPTPTPVDDSLLGAPVVSESSDQPSVGTAGADAASSAADDVAPSPNEPSAADAGERESE